MSRQDQYNVTVSVTISGETRDLGTFDKFDGGDIDSEEALYHPGGMAAALQLGGRVNVSNVTLARLYDLMRDHPIMGWLIKGVGNGEVTATKTSLTVDKKAIPNPLVYQGKLKRCTPPSHDSESSDPALFELEISSATVTQAS
jgi:hypothetical protein